jgi:transposase-like protein
MTEYRNSRAKYSYDYGMWYTEAFCPYCRRWEIVWGGGSTYRGRHVCSYCTWHLENRRKEAWK